MRRNIPIRRLLRQLLILALIVGATICIVPPPFRVCIWWASKAHIIAPAYLGLGMINLVLNKIRVMAVCLACSTAISLYHNEIASFYPVEDHSNGMYIVPSTEFSLTYAVEKTPTKF
jgi:hypothetical protein